MPSLGALETVQWVRVFTACSSRVPSLVPVPLSGDSQISVGSDRVEPGGISSGNTEPSEMRQGEQSLVSEEKETLTKIS